MGAHDLIKKIGNVNTEISFDPDWGKVGITADKAVKVVVTPKNSVGANWSFFLLLPKTDDEYEFRILIQQVVEMSLNEGDYYSVSDISEGDAESLEDDASCILTFNPLDDSEFVWLHPPKNLMH